MTASRLIRAGAVAASVGSAVGPNVSQADSTSDREYPVGVTFYVTFLPVAISGRSSELEEIREALSHATLNDSTKNYIIDVGISLVQDPKFRALLAERSGLQIVQPVEVVSREDVEDQEELNKYLILQNDRLQSELEQVKAALRSQEQTSTNSSHVATEDNQNESTGTQQGWWNAPSWILPIALGVAAIIFRILIKRR